MRHAEIYTLIAWAVFAASITEQAFAQCVTTESSSATVSIASATAPAPGSDLVLSFDGSTAVLADERDNEIAMSAGAVHVFIRQDDQWVFQQKLVPFDGVFGDQFGISAALSASGDTLIVGHWLDDDLGTNAGTASVFVRNDGTWSLQQKLTAPDGTAGDFFGVSVALAADGDLAVIGAHGDFTPTEYRVDDRDLARVYGVNSYPMLVGVGRDGRVRMVHMGFAAGDERELEKAVEQALAQDD